MQQSSVSNSNAYSGSMNGHGFASTRVRAAKHRMDRSLEHLRSLVFTGSYTALNPIDAGLGITSKQRGDSERHMVFPVSLAELLTVYPRKGTGNFVLGLDSRHRLIQFDICDSRVGNVLISGVRGAGKTSLLRTVGASLALENRQSDVQLCIVELREREPIKRIGGESLRSLGDLPHAIFPVIRTVEGGLGAIDFLTDELDYRRQRDIVDPLVVIIIDGVDQMLKRRERSLYRKLGYLLNHGPSSGYRLLLSVEDPISKEIRPLLKHKLPLRLVGKAIDADRAWAAAGIAGTKAEKLDGSGDFIAVRGDASHQFQCAYIGEEELLRLSRQLDIQKGRVLLANPAAAAEAKFDYRINGNANLSRSLNGTADFKSESDRSEKPNDSGSDDWLTANWEDRFWLDSI